MKRYSVCVNPDRRSIDLDIAGGATGRQVAADYGMSEATVRRHRAHLTDDYRPAMNTAEADQLAAAAGEIRDRLLALVRLHTSDLPAAEPVTGARPDHRVAVAAARAVVPTLELLGKLSGDLADGGDVTVVVEHVSDFPTGRTGGLG